MALLVGGAADVAPVVSGLLYRSHPAWPFHAAAGAAALGVAVLALAPRPM